MAQFQSTNIKFYITFAIFLLNQMNKELFFRLFNKLKKSKTTKLVSHIIRADYSSAINFNK